jgi:hypothetical protein
MGTDPPQMNHASLSPLHTTISKPSYSGFDSHSLTVDSHGTVKTISGFERFALVSSLYGPGNLACWFFLFISICLSWTINPSCARKDSITNDFIAMLALPVVAVAHFFHQAYHQNEKHDGETPDLVPFFSTLTWDNVRAVAAIEAPLTVCEVFVAWAAFLYLLAARKGQLKRMSLVLIVGLLCFSVEMLLWIDWVPFMSSLLIRPFFFTSDPS